MRDKNQNKAEMKQMPSELFTTTGKRKYLTQSEREVFLQSAIQFSREIRTFCDTLTLSGCRISEALALTSDRIDFEAGVIIFETLKKRRKGIFRHVPVPPALLEALDLVHGLKEAQKRREKPSRLWDMGRTTAWRRVQAVMEKAGIEGEHATAKGLRHGFGVHAVQVGVPLNLLQKWLGHADIATTAIYADAMGEEERGIASRMW